MNERIFIILDEASEEIISQYQWYEKARHGLGEEFLKELDHVYSHIQQFPNGFERKFNNFRFIKTNRFPFIVIYEVFDDAIVIFLAQSTSQDDKELIKKLKQGYKE